jgi:hypothetical protein
MGFEEIFEQDNNRYKHDKYSQYGHGEYDQTSRPHSDGNDLKLMVLNKLRKNPKMKALLVVISIILIIVLIILLVLFFPVLLRFLGFISENGIKGVLDSIWTGTK